MLHCSSIRQLEPKSGTRSDSVHFRVGSGRHASFIAAEVRVQNVGRGGWHVVVAVAANVFKILCDQSVDDKLGENVMRGNNWDGR